MFTCQHSIVEGDALEGQCFAQSVPYPPGSSLTHWEMMQLLRWATVRGKLDTCVG